MNKYWSLLLCGAIAACGSDNNNTADGGTPATDVVTPTDRGTSATDAAMPTDGGGGGGGDGGTTRSCLTEPAAGPICPTQRFMNNAMTPSWRVTALAVTAPMPLATGLILGVINPPLRDGRFLWGLSLDFTNNTFRTGPLNRMFTRGMVGQGLLDGTFAYYNNNAPVTGMQMAGRWNPAAGSFMGTSTVSTTDMMQVVNLPIFNDDGSILVELPLSNARLVGVPVSADRGCIGLGRPRAGNYNECTSEWDTEMGGTIEAAITVSSARGITIMALSQTLCQLLAGTSCDMPMPMWRNQPDAMVGSEPAYRLTAKFAAVSARIQ